MNSFLLIHLKFCSSILACRVWFVCYIPRISNERPPSNYLIKWNLCSLDMDRPHAPPIVIYVISLSLLEDDLLFSPIFSTFEKFAFLEPVAYLCALFQKIHHLHFFDEIIKKLILRWTRSLISHSPQAHQSRHLQLYCWLTERILLRPWQSWSKRTWIVRNQTF